VADRPGGWTALRWGLTPGSYQVTARPVGPLSTIAHPDRQIESKARGQSQRESGPGRDRRAHHRSHEATVSACPASCGRLSSHQSAGPFTEATTGGDGAMKEVFSFESLPQMVATSHLVIEGTVQEVEPAELWVTETLRFSSRR
jgi:hypothetical protein